MGETNKSNNIIKGKHITIHGKIKQEKEYTWHIPKRMRHHKIKVGDIVTVHTSVAKRPQRVVVTDVYREDVEVTGRYYSQVHEFIARPVMEVAARDLQSEEEIFLLHRVVEKMSMFTVLNKIAELKNIKSNIQFRNINNHDELMADIQKFKNIEYLISQLSEVVANKMLGEES